MWGISIYSLLVAFVQAIFIVTWAIKKGKWNLGDASWVELIGLMRYVNDCYLLELLRHLSVHFPPLTWHHLYILCLLQVPVLEIFNCNSLRPDTSYGGLCLFSLVVSAQTQYGSFARFTLGELIHFSVFRYL